MENENDKLSGNRKIFIVLGLALYLAAFGYNVYSDFSKDPINTGDIGTLTSMLVMFIITIIMMRPVFKRW